MPAAKNGKNSFLVQKGINSSRSIIVLELWLKLLLLDESMKASGILQKLREFLSTDIRRKLFFAYVFSKTSPSDLAESTATPLSTVDMVTNTLRLMELLEEAKGKKKSKNYYKVNMDTWLTENLKDLDMGFVEEKQKKEMLKIMDNQKFLALSFILTDPDFAMKLYKEPLKMGDDLIVFKLMRLFKKASLISDLPSYILMSVLIFPSFRKLKGNIFSEQGMAETTKLINDEVSKYPFLANALKEVDAAALKKYDEKRATLARLMQSLIEQELQLRSTEKVKKTMEAERVPEKAEEKKAPEEKKAAKEKAPKEAKPKKAKPEKT